MSDELKKNNYSEIVTLRWTGKNIPTEELNNCESDVRLMEFNATDMTRDDFIDYLERFMRLCGYNYNGYLVVKDI